MQQVRFWSVLAALYAIAIFIGSAIPAPDLPEVVSAVSDKVLHLLEYAILGFLVHRAMCTQRRWSALARNAVVMTVVIAIVYGASDELHQSFVPGRTADFLDWIADSAGAAIGIALSLWIFPRLFRRPQQGSL